MPPTDVTGSTIAMLNDTCGNLIQITQLGVVRLRRRDERSRSSTHRARPAGRRYKRTERSGRSFSSESCATRRKKSGRRLTDPAHLREWAPFDSRWSLGTVGSTVKLTTVNAPTPHVSETTVTRADAPRMLEYNWGDHDMRWELEALGGGTRLTLWTNIGRRFIAMGAAGWHICFDVLDGLLSGIPSAASSAPEAMKFAAGSG